MRTSVRHWARGMRRDVVAIYFAARDPRVPWYAKLVALSTAAYALSPIDLIPDFVPVLGYLDDLLIVPLGLALARRLIPEDILNEHRIAAERIAERPTSRWAAVVIVLVWIAVAGVAVWLLFSYRSRSDAAG